MLALTNPARLYVNYSTMDTGAANDEVVSVTESPALPPPAASPPFDFAEHERTAISDYLKEQPFYADLASVIARVIEECLRKRSIKVQSVQHRAKNPSSFDIRPLSPLRRTLMLPNIPSHSSRSLASRE